jgi:holliday junction DNA helicase RuvB
MTATEHAFSLAADIYPDDWEGFVGQDKVKRQLLVACRSAKKRGESLAHVLLASGEPGIGKTTLALLTAQEMGTQLKVISGPVKANEARIMLSAMRDGDVLFYEEFHQAVAQGKAKAEWLLNFLQDGVILGPRGAERQPAVTLIGATTDAARLPDTIISRFPLRPVLVPYEDDEAAVIGMKMASTVFGGGELPFPTVDDFRDIARAAANNPRTIGSILSNLRDLATVDLGHVWTGSRYSLSEALHWLGLKADGLTEVAVRYLIVMLDDFQAQAGEKALMDRLQEPNLKSVERLLMQREYITKTRQGRVLTGEGIRRARELKEEMGL